MSTKSSVRSRPIALRRRRGRQCRALAGWSALLGMTTRCDWSRRFWDEAYSLVALRAQLLNLDKGVTVVALVLLPGLAVLELLSLAGESTKRSSSRVLPVSSRGPVHAHVEAGKPQH